MTDFKLKYQIVADAAKAKAEVKSFDDILKGVGGHLGSSAGIAAIGAAGLTAGVALFNLTKQASDYGSAIFDASKKTGLGAESLSAMDFAAKQSGTSLEAITGGIAKFSKTVGEAADGSDKAAAKLKDLGITPQEALSNLDGALGKVFQRIIDAPPGIERMTLAQKAFGKSGADLLPFIDSFDGDLGKLIKKAKELGVTIDNDAARAADEFGDQLDTLSEQVAGAGRAITKELMVPFTDMARDVSAWLKDNPGEVKSWGETFAYVLRRVGAGVLEFKTNWAGLMDEIQQLKNGLSFDDPAFVERERQRQVILQKVANIVAGTDIRGNWAQEDEYANYRAGNLPYAGRGAGTGGDSSGKKGGSKKIADKLPAFGSMKSLVISSGNAQWDSWFNQMGQKYNVDPNVLLLQAGAESSFNRSAVSAKGARGFSQIMPGTAEQYGIDTSTVKGSITGQARIMADLLSRFGGDYTKALAGYNAGPGAVDKYHGIPPYRETREYVSKIQGRYRSRVQKGTGSFGTFDYDAELAARQQEADEELDLVTEAINKEIAAEKQASSDRLEIRELEADHAVSLIEDMVARGEMTELEAAKRVGKLKIDILEDERKELLGQISTKENMHRLDVLRLKIDDQKLKNSTEELEIEKKITAEYNAQISALRKKNERPYALGKRETPEEYAERVRRAGQTTVGSGNEIGAMSQLHDYFVGEKNAAAIAGVDAMTQALDGMGQALGSVVNAWVLYGSAGENAQQVTAQILAGIAQQATVKAVFELAEGFAMLALSFFGHPGAGPSATQHFIAAGIYAGIAGGAALAGRAVAGHSFTKGAGGGHGSFSSSSSYAGSNRQQDLRPISRASDDVYISGHRPHEVAIAKAIEKLNKKIDSMSPGDVLVAGARQKRGFIGKQTVDDMKSRPQLGTRMLRQVNAR